MAGATDRVAHVLGVPLLHWAVKQAATLPDEVRKGLGNRDYQEFTWDRYHRGYLKPSALIAIAHLLLILRDLEGTCQKLVNLAMLFQMILMFVLTLKLPPQWRINAPEWARWVVLSFSLGKIVMTWVLFVSDEHPGDSVVRVCERWLDTITNMGISVPTLAMAHFSSGAWFVFLGLHIAASAPFYVKWLRYSAAWAVFKVVFIQVLSLLAYAAMERSKFVAYVKSREQALQKKLTTSGDMPSEGGGVAATLKRDTSAKTNTKQSYGVAECSSSVEELEQTVIEQHTAAAAAAAAAAAGREQPSSASRAVCPAPSPEPQIVSPHVYTSRFKKNKVMLKIHCDCEPDNLLTGPNSNLLHSLLKSSLPGSLIVESAVRHGCVVVSVDFCEPLRIDDEAPLSSSAATEHEVASKVAGSILKWLHASDAQRLKDGTVVSIQVNKYIFKGSWDANTQSVQLLEDADTLPTKEQYSITQPEPAILLPALQPTQELHIGSVSFLANVSAPTNDKLFGWQNIKGAEHAVEGEGKGAEGVLQLLAHTQGIFLPVTATEVGRGGNGERSVQVCVSLLPSMLMNGQCFRLELELVKSNTLLCSNSVLLMGSQLSEALQDLKGWSVSNAHAPEAVGVFLEDLAEFLSFRGLVALSTTRPVDTRSGGADVALEKSLLPVLQAEAQTPDMLHMMAEVGLELLQHALSWGMAALAQQLLTGLMAEPLRLPFDTVASGQLPHAHPFAKGEGNQRQQRVQEQQQQQQSLQEQQQQQQQQQSLQEQQRQQQQKVQEQQKELGDATTHEAAQHVHPSALSLELAAVLEAQWSENAVQRHSVASSPSSFRTLITCALLSYNKQCLAQVLEWGRTYGAGGPHGYAWPWVVVDASGYSPIQIIARLPADHAILEQLLADPTTKPAVLQAQGVAQQVRESAEKAAAKMATSQPFVHAQLLPGSADASVRQGYGFAASAPSQFALHAQHRAGSADELAGCTAQAGSSKAQEEGDSAIGQQTTCMQLVPTLSTHLKCAWLSRSLLKVALKALVFGFGEHDDVKEADYRTWCFESTAGYANLWCCLVVVIACWTLIQCLFRGLLLNSVVLCLYPVLMSLALFAESTSTRKMYMTTGKIVLMTIMFIFSKGLLPSFLAQKMAVLGLDWAVEIFMYRLADQVQFKALLVERAISCVCNTCMYSRLGFSFPLGRAFTLNLCSLLVGLALDVRNRCIFLKIRALSAAGVRGSQRKVQKAE